MKLYAILQALLGILVADAPVKTIEHVDKDHMVLVTETHRVTVTVEKLPQTVSVLGMSVTNLIIGDSITYEIGPSNRGISPSNSTSPEVLKWLQKLPTYPMTDPSDGTWFMPVPNWKPNPAKARQ